MARRPLLTERETRLMLLMWLVTALVIGGYMLWHITRPEKCEPVRVNDSMGIACPAGQRPDNQK